MKKPEKKITFNFFNFKWGRVPAWGLATESIYRTWYLKRYGYSTEARLKQFLANKHRILEAGCGLARDSKFFATLNSHAQIVAMDQSPEALKMAANTLKQFKNCRVVRADITNFQHSGMFDFISCDQVIHHTPDPASTLRHLFSRLKRGGVINFSVCRKKNIQRDFIDDLIMERAQNMKPEELWKFAEAVTQFGKALSELGIDNVSFDGKRYANIQEFVHYRVFRCWYNKSLDFRLSVSSNYDWFSGNPRFNTGEVKEILKGLDRFKLLRFHEDQATISVSVQKP